MLLFRAPVEAYAKNTSVPKCPPPPADVLMTFCTLFYDETAKLPGYNRRDGAENLIQSSHAYTSKNCYYFRMIYVFE